MENWLFFGANLAFTAFNAWVAWKNWQRTAAADLPSVSVRAYRSREVDAVEIEVLTSNRTNFAWKAEKAVLVAPRGQHLLYPLSLMRQNPATGEPWNVESVRLDRAVGSSEVPLTITAEPSGQTYREVLWVRGIGSGGGRIELRLVFLSSEPQPRRHTVKVIRTVPALKAVSAT
jgi:hypothetical protein